MVIHRLRANGFNIKHALLDLGFCRDRVIVKFKRWGVTVIMLGRSCKEIENLIYQYPTKNGLRRGKGYMRFKYVRGVGYPRMEFDLFLQAKRSFGLGAIKRNFNKGRLSLEQASKRIFPLLVLIARMHGIRKLKENESHARLFYRSWWSIKITFYGMNRLAITTRYRHCDGRLAVMGAKIFLCITRGKYNAIC
ncbi:MAG: hypothetical protein ACTSWN_13395 [Promethearchaeota archaeon]